MLHILHTCKYMHYVGLNFLTFLKFTIFYWKKLHSGLSLFREHFLTVFYTSFWKWLLISVSVFPAVNWGVHGTYLLRYSGRTWNKKKYYACELYFCKLMHIELDDLLKCEWFGNGNCEQWTMALVHVIRIKYKINIRNSFILVSNPRCFEKMEVSWALPVKEHNSKQKGWLNVWAATSMLLL